jgi:hypothetical protein
MARNTQTQAADASAPAHPAGPARAPRRKAATQQLQTFAHAIGSREPSIQGAADSEKTMRSFNVRVATVERLRATLALIGHRAYGTELAATAPDSLAAMADEALNAACTYYENLLNDGQEAPRIIRLPPGPSPIAAQQGAAKRAARRASKAAEGR